MDSSTFSIHKRAAAAIVRVDDNLIVLEDIWCNIVFILEPQSDIIGYLWNRRCTHNHYLLHYTKNTLLYIFNLPCSASLEHST